MTAAVTALIFRALIESGGMGAMPEWQRGAVQAGRDRMHVWPGDVAETYRRMPKIPSYRSAVTRRESRAETMT